MYCKLVANSKQSWQLSASFCTKHYIFNSVTIQLLYYFSTVINENTRVVPHMQNELCLGKSLWTLTNFIMMMNEREQLRWIPLAGIHQHNGRFKLVNVRGRRIKNRESCIWPVFIQVDLWHTHQSSYQAGSEWKKTSVLIKYATQITKSAFTAEIWHFLIFVCL